MGERIAVVGATGYTGRLVVQELAGRGVEVIAVGRTAVVDGFGGCDAVVSCIGSFVDSGESVVTAAIAAGVPYVDVSAEFPFLRRLHEVYDRPARQAGVALVPGMAFYSAPADLACALAAQALDGPAERIEVAYHLAGARPSRGTIRTNLRRLGEPCPVWAAGRFVSRRIGDDPREFAFPEPVGSRPVARWPGGETLTVPRHTGVGSVDVFLAMPKPAAAVLRRPVLTALLQRIGRRIVGARTGGPADEARRRARFVIVAEARSAQGSATRCVVEGHDLYGVTATCCAEAAVQLSAPAEPRAGVLAPAEVFDPAAFLDSLSGHLTWHREGIHR